MPKELVHPDIFSLIKIRETEGLSVVTSMRPSRQRPRRLTGRSSYPLRVLSAVPGCQRSSLKQATSSQKVPSQLSPVGRKNIPFLSS